MLTFIKKALKIAYTNHIIMFYLITLEQSMDNNQSLNSILNEDTKWRKEFDSMKITGTCDNDLCDNDAKHWYGNTNQAHCGNSECIKSLNMEYNELARQISSRNNDDDEY